MPIITVSSASGANPNQELAYAQITTNATTTQTVQASATTILTAASITFDGATRALVEFFAPAVGHSVDQGQVLFDLWSGSTDLATIGEMRVPAGSSTGPAVDARMILTPAAGATVFTLRAWIITAGTGTINAGAGTGAAFAPAFLRVSLAPAA